MVTQKNIILGCAVCLVAVITGCQSTYWTLRVSPPTEYTAFLPRHELLESQPETFPFRRLWMNKQINWQKYQYIYVAPVDTSHLFKKTTWEKINARVLTHEQFDQGIQQITGDVNQISRFMRQEFIKALKKNSRKLGITVVPDSFPGCLVVRLALVKLVPTKVFMNAGGVAANIFMPGSGVVANMSSSGVVAVEGMLMESSGRMLMMFAEQDKDTVTLVDVDGLTWYSHSKNIITEWSTDFCQIIKNPNYKKVKKSFPAKLISI
jgi:uncharacterized protein DUF3313